MIIIDWMPKFGLLFICVNVYNFDVGLYRHIKHKALHRTGTCEWTFENNLLQIYWNKNGSKILVMQFRAVWLFAYSNIGWNISLLLAENLVAAAQFYLWLSTIKSARTTGWMALRHTVHDLSVENTCCFQYSISNQR